MSDNTSTPWYRLDPAGDIPTDFGLHCNQCGQIACTCSLYSSSDATGQLDPGPAGQLDPGPWTDPGPWADTGR